MELQTPRGYVLDVNKEVLALDLDILYNTYHPNGIKGDIGICIKKIEELERPISERILEKGLEREDKCAVIVNFYPNGNEMGKNKLEKACMRNGVGAEILKLIIEDCSKVKAPIIYSQTKSQSYTSFLTKHGFKELNIPGNGFHHFYKLL